jgi:hypothetical protein
MPCGRRTPALERRRRTLDDRRLAAIRLAPVNPSERNNETSRKKDAPRLLASF